jgi:SpoVK/Ycf46/Vps4 family AAA+-type ATPase
LQRCSEEFRQQLVQAVYIYLKHPDFVKHTKSLSSMSRGVMLVGPPGA